MNKKKIFLLVFFFLGTLIFFLSPEKVFGGCGSTSICEPYIGKAVPPYCCHIKAGCSTAQCPSFSWYSYCRASECCWETKDPIYGTDCGSWYWWPSPYSYCAGNFNYKYVYTTCPATDSCEGGPKLKCGLCLPSGACGKCDGFYKQCCDNVTMAVCSHGCIGGNTTGTCGSGCQSVIAASCPGGGVACNGYCTDSSQCASGRGWLC